MRSENSHGQLFTGLLFGALAGACATYFIIKNKESIQKGWEDMNDKVKESMNQLTDRVKEKASDLTRKAKDRIHDAEEAAECLEEKLHHAASTKK